MVPQSIRRIVSLSYALACFVPSAILFAQTPKVEYSSAHRDHAHRLAQTLSGSTKARAKLQTGRSGISVVAADFDSDGTIDLVTGYATSGGGALLLQRGSPTMLAPTPSEMALRAAGQFVTPFASKSEAIEIPVRPDLMLSAELGHGHTDLLVAAKGDSSAYLLLGDGKGGFSAPVALPLSGTIAALSNWHTKDGKGLIGTAVCGASGCGVQMLTPEGKTVGFVPTPAVATSIELKNINAGAQQDMLLLADGKVLLVDGDSILTESPVVETLPVANVAAVTAGAFIYNYGGGAQVAALGVDATLHIFSREAINSRTATKAEIMARRAAAMNHTAPLARTPKQTGLPWQEVETTLNFGSGGASALLLHGHFSGAGLDDVVGMVGTQYVQLSHPSVAEGAVRKTTPVLTVDSSEAPVVAALAARVSPSARTGIVTADATVHPNIAAPVTNHTYNVNTTADPAYNATTFATARTACTNNTAGCTLRAAIANATADNSANGVTKEDVINIPAGTYTIAALNGGVAIDDEGSVNYHFDLDGSMSLVGAGAASTIINGNGIDIVFSVDSGASSGGAFNFSPMDVFLSNMTIENGVNPNNPSSGNCGYNCTFFGGGVSWESDGTGYLTLTNVIVLNNKALWGNGGGVFAANFNNPQMVTEGVLDVESSTFSGNSTSESGGAIYSDVVTPLYVNNSTFTSNKSDTSVNTSDTASYAKGGAIWVGDTTGYGSVTIQNSTFTSNSAVGKPSQGNGPPEGGAIYLNGPATLTGNTFTNNTAGNATTGGFGGAIHVFLNEGTDTITTSTFTGNSAGGDGGAVCQQAQTKGSGASPTITMQYNRIHGNTVASATYGSHTGFAQGCGTTTAAGEILNATATNNWWGCNAAPTAAPCDTVGTSTGQAESGQVLTTTPYTVLTETLTSTTPAVGAMFTATGALNSNSSGTVYTTAQDAAYNGVPATLVITQGGGGTTSSSATALAGSATIATTATANQAGSGTAVVTVDGVSVSLSFTVQAPNFSVTSSHTGNFKAGSTGNLYTLTATNGGNLASSGTVTVVDTLPSGFTATALSGTGWTCTVGTFTCTRSDALAAGSSYPAITLTVSVGSSNAGAYVNSVTVSGGNDINTSNNTGTDSTIVVGAPTIAEAFSPSTVAPNANSTITFTLGNPSANTVSQTGVGFTDTLPVGLVVSTPSAAATTCTSGTVTAAGGGSSIQLSGATIASGATCTATVNVVSANAGSYPNTTGAVSSANGATGSTASATLTVAVTPTKLVYTTAPATPIAAGGNAGAVSVALEDAANNIATNNSTASVTLTVTGPNSYSQVYTATASNGVATFNLTSVAITTMGSYTYTASSSGLTSAVATETVNAGAFAALTVTGLGAFTAPGQSGTATVKALDAYGNVVTGFTGMVTISSTDPLGVYSPISYTYVAGDAGSHAFTITLNTAGTRIVTATSGAITGSQTIVVSDAVLIVNASGTLSRFTDAGVATSPSGGYTGGGAPNIGIAVDASGNIWSANKTSNVLAEFNKSGTALSGTGYTGGGLSTPSGVAVDGLGTVWISNNNGSVSQFSNTGVALSPATGYPGGGAGSTGVAIDISGNVWISNGTSSTVTEIIGGAAPVPPLATGVTNVTTGTRP